MPSVDYIDVRITANGEALQEYLDPVDNSDGARARVRYIEAVPGQQFRVLVRLLPGFELKHAPWFASQFRVDEENDIFYPSSLSADTLSHKKGTLAKTCVLQDYGSFRIWDDAFGRWDNCAFEFGALGTNEEALDKVKHSPQNVSNIGTIRVTFFRAKNQKRKKPFRWHGKVSKPVDELPEQALKGRDIKANTKFTRVGEADPHTEPEYDERVPIEGPRGKPYEITFKYRTRKALQNLGFIERSPTPEPDAGVMLARERAMNRHLLDQLAQYRSGSVKTEDSATVRGRSATPQVKQERTFARPFPTPVSDRPATSRKRGRDDFEADDDVIETPPAPKARRLEIDLTGDDD